MNEADNVTFVKQCYAAYGRGDVGQLLACMAPQIEWELPEVPGVPYTGKRCGSDKVAEYFQLSGERQTVREFTPREFIAQGDKVVVLGHGAWQVNETGNEFQSDWVHIFTIRDGQIAAFREFLDSNVAAEAFGCGPATRADQPATPAPLN